jgi:hypothetical protein
MLVGAVVRFMERPWVAWSWLPVGSAVATTHDHCMTTTQINGLLPLSAAQEETFQAWRAKALEQEGGMPYMASMLFSLRPINAPGLGTFAVDASHRLYIDFDAVDPKGVRWCAEALLHECCHLFGEHAARAEDAGVTSEERELANYACFPAGTLMPGNVPIEDVATMQRHFDGDLVVVDSQAGEIMATPEHPFFARKRRHKKGCYPIVLEDAAWTDASVLTDGHYLCVPKIKTKRSDTEIDLVGYALPHGRSGASGISGRTVRSIPLNADTAWLIGLYVAEGSSSPTVRFSLGAHEDEIMERVERISSDIGYSASRSYAKDSAACTVSLGTSVWGRWLKQHCGADAHDKHVPEVVLHHADPAIRRAFVEGVQDGDGYERKWNADGSHRLYAIKTASKSLMHDLVLLLAQDGIGCHTSVELQRPRNIDGYIMPDGVLYGVAFNPDGARPTERTLNGKAIQSYSHRWKADDDGVWYPITSIGSRRHAGPVYNMTTVDHTYIVHSYLVHNCDAEINDDLRDAGCDMSDAVLPSTIGCDDYDVFEVYLEHLRRRRQQKQQQKSGGSGSGQGQGGQGKASGNGQGSGQGSKGKGGDQNGQGGGNGQSDGSGQPGQFHGCGSGSGGAPAPCELADGDNGQGQFPGATQAERDQATLATAIAIQEEGTSGRGTVPAGLRAQAAIKLRPSKVSWQRQLSASVRRAVGSRSGDFDNTWSRRSRRSNGGCSRTGGRVMRPGTFTPTPTIAVVRDTSGSMGGDDLNEASSEIDAIAKQLGIRGEELQVLDCDAVVHLSRGYKGKATLNDVAGRGGTNMVEGIRVAMELRPKPTAIVVVTDGGTPWPAERLATPIVACLVGRYAESTSGHVPEWIKTIVVD